MAPNFKSQTLFEVGSNSNPGNSQHSTAVPPIDPLSGGEARGGRYALLGTDEPPPPYTPTPETGTHNPSYDSTSGEVRLRPATSSGTLVTCDSARQASDPQDYPGSGPLSSFRPSDSTPTASPYSIDTHNTFWSTYKTFLLDVQLAQYREIDDVDRRRALMGNEVVDSAWRVVDSKKELERPLGLFDSPPDETKYVKTRKDFDEALLNYRRCEEGTFSPQLAHPYDSFRPSYDTRPPSAKPETSAWSTLWSKVEGVFFSRYPSTSDSGLPVPSGKGDLNAHHAHHLDDTEIARRYDLEWSQAWIDLRAARYRLGRYSGPLCYLTKGQRMYSAKASADYTHASHNLFALGLKAGESFFRETPPRRAKNTGSP